MDAMKTLEHLCLRIDDDDDDDGKLNVVGFSFKAIAVNVYFKRYRFYRRR